MMKEKVRLLEDRVTRLEEELRQVKDRMANHQVFGQPWWQAIAGRHEGSQAFETIVREMHRLRRKEYQAAQAQAANKSTPKSRRNKTRSGQKR
jgi:hypothetical protein